MLGVFSAEHPEVIHLLLHSLELKTVTPMNIGALINCNDYVIVIFR